MSSELSRKQRSANAPADVAFTANGQGSSSQQVAVQQNQAPNVNTTQPQQPCGSRPSVDDDTQPHTTQPPASPEKVEVPMKWYSGLPSRVWKRGFSSAFITPLPVKARTAGAAWHKARYM